MSFIGVNPNLIKFAFILGCVGFALSTLKLPCLFSVCKAQSFNIALSTGVDSLAPAVGSVHGLYNGQANLNFDRMREISIKTGVPLVLHGGTGISNEDLLRAVECGTCKININTELQVAWASEVRSYLNLNNDVYDPRKIISSGEEAIKKIVREKVRILSNI